MYAQDTGPAQFLPSQVISDPLDLAIRTREVIATQPQAHEQAVWFSNKRDEQSGEGDSPEPYENERVDLAQVREVNSCDTVACVAGWAALMGGWWWHLDDGVMCSLPDPDDPMEQAHVDNAREAAQLSLTNGLTLGQRLALANGLRAQDGIRPLSLDNGRVDDLADDDITIWLDEMFDSDQSHSEVLTRLDRYIEALAFALDREAS